MPAAEGTRHRPATAELRRHGLLRRQHRHGALELRAALRDERQLVRDDVRPLDPGRGQRHRRQHLRRALRPGVRCPRTAPCTDAPGAAPATPGTAVAQGPGRCTATPTPTSTSARRPRTTDRRPDDPDGRQEHRRPAEREERLLGLVPGRLRQPGYQPGKPATDDPSAICTGTSSERSRPAGHGLQPPPRAVPVLRVHGQPAAPAADVGREDRVPGPGEPPVRPEGLLRRRRRQQPAGGLAT